MALTQGRNTPFKKGEIITLPVKSGAIIYEGSIVVIDSTGYAIPGTKEEGLTVAGRAEQYINNTTGNDGDIFISVRRGVFRYANDKTNPVLEVSILKDCYILDDETVTSNMTETSRAGKVLGIDEFGIWVEIK